MRFEVSQSHLNTGVTTGLVVYFSVSLLFLTCITTGVSVSVVHLSEISWSIETMDWWVILDSNPMRPMSDFTNASNAFPVQSHLINTHTLQYSNGPCYSSEWTMNPLLLIQYMQGYTQCDEWIQSWKGKIDGFGIEFESELSNFPLQPMLTQLIQCTINHWSHWSFGDHCSSEIDAWVSDDHAHC